MDNRILLPECQQFIRDHEQSDTFELSLKGNSGLDVDQQALILQIKSRQIAARKAEIFYKAKGIYYPPPISMEQSSSDASAGYKQSLLKANHLIDLTGGGGIDALYFSDVVKNISYVEREAELCEIFQHNINILSRRNIEVIKSDAMSFLDHIDQVDTIYIDPSRRTENRKVYSLQDSEPNIIEAWNTLISKTNHLLIKASPMLSVYDLLEEIQEPLHLHFIAIKNELKEILIEWSSSFKNTEFYCANLESDHALCHWTPVEESDAIVSLHDPMQYIYEPNAAIMKAGGYRWISQEFKLHKLHKNTHLYTSDQLIKFPGKRFELLNSLTSKELRKIKKANIAVRNHPLSPEEIKKKYKISDGGENYIYGCTLMDQSKTFLQLKRIN